MNAVTSHAKELSHKLEHEARQHVIDCAMRLVRARRIDRVTEKSVASLYMDLERAVEKYELVT